MTTQREQRLQDVFQKRQFDVTVVLENVWDPHNVSAVLRSCDAVGIQEVYIISPKEKKESIIGKKSSASAGKWLTIHHFRELNDCFEELRRKYEKIYATRLQQEAVELYEMDLTQSVALVFGNEKNGVSEEAATLSDGNFLIPQVGMIQSLNISVACAVTLYECYRQRNIKGMYDLVVNNPELSPIFTLWKQK